MIPRVAVVLLAAFAIAGVRTAAARTPGRLDCEDVDYDCQSDHGVVRGIRQAASHLARCLRSGVACDLTPDLASITSPECRDAVECEVRGVADAVGNGRPACARRLFLAGARFMAAKVAEVRRHAPEPTAATLARCVARAAHDCPAGSGPTLGGACAGQSGAAGEACVCSVANDLGGRLVVAHSTCRKPPERASAPATPPSRPNFVFILSDDQRWDMIDATHEAPKRPGPVMPIVTRELVDSGVTFTNANVTTALCCPSRTSIFSGEYSHRTGVHGNHPPDGGAQVFDDASTIATWLHDAGYRTGLVGKYLNGYATESPCIPPGWDDWHAQVEVKYYDYLLNDNGRVTELGHAPVDYSVDVMTARAVDFLRTSAASAQPFFLYVAYKAPHKPATPAPRHIGLFAGVPPWRPPNYAEPDVADKPEWVRQLRWTADDAEDSDTLRRLMLESLQSVDEGVGTIMATLRELGIDDRTVVLFMSDNGYSLGAHRWEVKQCPYEECMRVPLVVRAPAFGTTPRTDDRFVLNVDVAPTLVDLAAATVPATHVVNGRSLVPLLAGTDTDWRDAMLNEHWPDAQPIPENALVKQGRCSATRDTVCRSTADCPPGETCDTWKYVEYFDGARELYDLAADPYELTNVAADPANAPLEADLAVRLHALQAE